MARLSRAEYKRRYRAKRAAREGRERDLLRCLGYRPQDAHVKEYRAHLVAIYWAKLALHDAHVKRYRLVLKDRARALAKYKKSPGAERARQSARKAALADSYVVQCLASMGLPRAAIEPGLVDLKREQMLLRRLSIDLKKAANKSIEDNR